MLGESVEIATTLTRDFVPGPGESLLGWRGAGYKSGQEHDSGNETSVMGATYRLHGARS
jgi:hypothetical protein